MPWLGVLGHPQRRRSRTQPCRRTVPARRRRAGSVHSARRRARWTPPGRDRGDERAGAPRCEHDPERRAHGGPDRCFDEALPDDAPAAGADRQVYRDLTAPGKPPRQKQARRAATRPRTKALPDRAVPERLLELIAHARETSFARLQCGGAAQIRRPALPRHGPGRGRFE